MLFLTIFNIVLLLFMMGWVLDLDTVFDEYEKTQKQLLREIKDLRRDLL